MKINGFITAVVLAGCMNICTAALADHPMLDKVIERYRNNVTWEEARAAILEPKQHFLVKKDGLYGVFSRDGKAILPVEYKKIEKLENGLILLKKDGKYGISDTEGNSITDVAYEEIRSFNDEFFRVKEKGKYGVINSAGKVILSPAYEKIILYDDLFVVTANKKSGIYNLEGKLVLSCLYDFALPSGNGGYIAGSKDSYWFYDENRRILSKQSFIDAKPFSEGLAVIKTAEGYGYLEETGAIKIKPFFDRAEKFMENAAYVEKWENRYFIDTEGNKLFDAPAGKYINGFKQGTALFKNEGKFLFVNHSGDVEFEIKAAAAVKMKNGMIAVTRNRHNISAGGILQSAITMAAGIPTIPGVGKSVYDTVIKVGYYDENGKELISSKNDFNSTIVDDSVISIAHDKAGFVNLDGTHIIPIKFDDLSDYDWDNAKSVVVRQDKQYGFYDVDTASVKGNYLYAENFVNGLAAVQITESRWTYIAADRKMPWQKYWSFTTPFYGEFAIVKNLDGRYCIINNYGEETVVLNENIAAAEALMPDTAIVKSGDKFGLIDETGRFILRVDYDEIKYL